MDYLFSEQRIDSAQPGEQSMLDVVFVAIGVAFFALSIGYVLLCDRL